MNERATQTGPLAIRQALAIAEQSQGKRIHDSNTGYILRLDYNALLFWRDMLGLNDRMKLGALQLYGSEREIEGYEDSLDHVLSMRFQQIFDGRYVSSFIELSEKEVECMIESQNNVYRHKEHSPGTIRQEDLRNAFNIAKKKAIQNEAPSWRRFFNII